MANVTTKDIHELLTWYEQVRRPLPWRADRSPYRVWVSEIMLQQTRIEAVMPYFERFMTALPTVKDLAQCPQDKLLKLWEGLGYYNRVRNLQKAAQLMMGPLGGRFPDTYEELLKLPGVGEYTAGAVASISFDRDVPAVDGNVMRVFARLTLMEEDIMKQSVRKNVFGQLLEMIPEGRGGAFNQALMELGETLCVPKGEIRCDECPLKECCKAKACGRQKELPVRIVKTKKRIEQHTVLVVRDGDELLLHKREDKGLLAGLYELPMEKGVLEREQVVRLLREMGLDPVRIGELPEAKHIFSHVEWHMNGFMVLVSDLSMLTQEARDRRYFYAENERTQDEIPVPGAFAAYMKYADIEIGAAKLRKIDEGK